MEMSLKENISFDTLLHHSIMYNKKNDGGIFFRYFLFILMKSVQTGVMDNL